MLHPSTQFKIEGDELIVRRVQQCTPVADYCAALRGVGATGGEDMRLAAELPMVMVEAYCNDKGITYQDWIRDPEHARAMLNDPALAAFRVWEGRV